MSLAFPSDKKDRDLYVETPGGGTSRQAHVPLLRSTDGRGGSGTHQGDVDAPVSALPQGIPRTVTAEAERLVAGDRRSAYDHPADNLGQTADLFTAFLRRKLTAPITAEEVAWLMVMVKASRESFSHSRDNIVDAIGYLRCTELIREAHS